MPWCRWLIYTNKVNILWVYSVEDQDHSTLVIMVGIITKQKTISNMENRFRDRVLFGRWTVPRIFTRTSFEGYIYNNICKKAQQTISAKRHNKQYFKITDWLQQKRHNEQYLKITDWLINQSMNQKMNQLINQHVNQPTNQPINKDVHIGKRSKTNHFLVSSQWIHAVSKLIPILLQS